MVAQSVFQFTIWTEKLQLYDFKHFKKQGYPLIC